MKRGFTVVEEQEVLLGGVMLRRYAMREAVATQEGTTADRGTLTATPAKIPLYDRACGFRESI